LPEHIYSALQYIPRS